MNEQVVVFPSSLEIIRACNCNIITIKSITTY